MKAIQGEINLDDVQKLMDDTAEAKAYQDVSYFSVFLDLTWGHFIYTPKTCIIACLTSQKNNINYSHSKYKV